MRMAGAGTTSARDDLFNIAISIRRRFEGLSPPSDCCIFTVPERLRGSNQEAYTPRVVAIGPYHHRNQNLMPMEDQKLLYLENFLQYHPEHCLEDYIQRVKSLEHDARNCHDKQIDLNSNRFTQMMLLDGIFVIQLFWMYWNPLLRMRWDRIFNKPYMLGDVRCDMTLLENQMPFFVIQQLFEMGFGKHQRKIQMLGRPGLLALACCFFKLNMRMENLPEDVSESEVKHFVHMIRLSFFPSRKERPESYEKLKFPPSATELVAAGVKLRRGKSECLIDVEFDNGVLKIPYLALYDSTESYFRNIIAFDQCYHRNDRYLIDYIAFMDYLVDTPDDAKLLIDKKIIENWLGNKEAVAQLFNSFGKGANLSNYYFNSLSHKLIDHCEKPHNKWKATFKRDYCSNPWVVISVIAAVVLLLLTAVQTMCSVLSLV